MPRRREAGGAEGTHGGSSAGSSAENNDDARASLIQGVMQETDRRLAESGARRDPPSKMPLYLGSLMLCVAYFLYPCKMKPQPVEVGPPVDWSGALSPATHTIGAVEPIHKKLLHGPDSFVFNKEGVLYIATAEGAVWRWPGTGQPVVIAHIGNVSCTFPQQGPECGRPVGMALSADERTLFVADSYYGLSSVSLPAGHVERILPLGTVIEDGEPPLIFANGVQRVGDAVYMSETSTHWAPDEEVCLPLAASKDGRILKYDSKTGKTSIFAKRLISANGLSVTADGEYLLVCETVVNRVSKIDLSDGEVSVHVDNLPGMPNSIEPHPSGGHLIGMGTVRTGMLDMLMTRPWLRLALYKLIPQSILVRMADPHSMCVHVNGESGTEIVDSWHDNDGRVVERVLQCRIHGGYIYFNSHTPGSGLSRMKLKRRN